MKSLNNFLVNGSGMGIGRGLDPGSRLSAIADKFDNDKPSEPVLQGIAGGAISSLRVAEPRSRFLQRVRTIF